MTRVAGWPGNGRAAALFVLLIFALFSLGGCAALGERERQAVYRPSRAIPAAFSGLEAGDRTYFVAAGNPGVGDQRVQIWWLPGPDSRAPTLLYLHGTFRNLYHNYPKMLAIREAGYSVLGVEYRGWGESSVLVPSEDSIYADAEIGWRELVLRQPDPMRRVIYGHSMGAAVAVELAARKSDGRQYGGLILESAFNSAVDVAAAASIFAAPLVWLSGQRFDSQAKIGALHQPILMLHGTNDNTVPLKLGRRLFDAAAGSKTFVEFAAGSHSGLHSEAPARYRSAFADFAARLLSRPCAVHVKVQ